MMQLPQPDPRRFEEVAKLRIKEEERMEWANY